MTSQVPPEPAATGARPSPALIMRKAKTLAAAGWDRQLLVAKATAELARARYLVKACPFNHIAQRLGEWSTPAEGNAARSVSLSEADARTAKAIGWAVHAAARFMPFRALCLEQAIAAQAMLRRRGIATVMHFGAAKRETATLDAHAWLDASNVRVTGYPLDPTQTEIGCFIQKPAKQARPDGQT